MKVLFVHPSYPNQFTRVAHRLNEQPDMECACLVDLAFAPNIQADGVPITYYGYQKDGDSAGSGYFYTSNYEDAIRHGKGIIDVLTSLVQQGLVELVIGHAAFGATFFAKTMLNVPVISYVELPGYDMAYSRKEFPRLDQHRLLEMSLKSLLYTSALFSDLVIVPSQYAKAFFPPELQPKIRVQMEGFRLPVLEKDSARLRKTLALPEEGPIIGFAGRTLEAMRGFDIFVKVAARLKKERPDVHFLVLGNEQTIYGNEQAYLGGKSFKAYVLEQEHMDEQHIIFRTFQPYPDFLLYLQCMDLMLFPIFEGAANWSLFEAMAAGRILLASNRAFLPEIITSGQSGFLFDPYNIDGFVDTSLNILAHPEWFVSIGMNARRRIESQYSVENAAAGYRALIEEGLSQHDT